MTCAALYHTAENLTNERAALRFRPFRPLGVVPSLARDELVRCGL